MGYIPRSGPRASAGRRPTKASASRGRRIAAADPPQDEDHLDDEDEEDEDEELEDGHEAVSAKSTAPKPVQVTPRLSARPIASNATQAVTQTTTIPMTATPRALEAFRPILETQMQIMRLWAAALPRLPSFTAPWTPATFWLSQMATAAEPPAFSDEGDTYALCMRITPSQAERVSVRCGSGAVEVDLGGPMLLAPLNPPPQRFEAPDDGDLDGLKATYDGEALILRLPKFPEDSIRPHVSH